MDLVTVILTPGPDSAHRGPEPDPDPEALVDILWANTLPCEQVEHLRARAGPEPGTTALAVFLKTDRTGRHTSDADPTSTTLRLCHRAIHASPWLTGWTAVSTGTSLADLSGAFHAHE